MIGVGEVHRLTVDDFERLASARPGAAALDVLRRSQFSRRLLTLRSVAALGRERFPVQWRAAGAEPAWELLEAVDRTERRALEAVLMHPPVGVLLARCLRRLTGQPQDGSDLERDLARLGALAVGAALRARLPVSLRLPVHGDRLALPGWGVARLPSGTSAVRVEGAVLSAPGFSAEPRTPGAVDPPAGAPGWLPLRALALPPSAAASDLPALRLTLEDGDPDRHNPGARSAPRLTTHQLGEWEDSLGGAWELLTEHFPDRATVCAALCTCVVPLTPPPGGWASSASREAFGAIWLSPTNDTARLAEALVHEVSHVVLGALGDMVDLHDPDHADSYTVGWRSDPRPLGAVLQGTYAHVARLAFWDRYRRVARTAEADRAERHHRLLRGQVLDALELLDGCTGLTALGRRFCDRMAAGVMPRPGHMTPRYSNG
ncbi:HEXXH motif domain-containing protein [Peterkaempfera sp. SMS 1(5)a]|uniref:HEXXH motif domain-containing protein n=1 Tax=Peterkaempfera podocarpi TaxID=3232308 RepID=UPI00366F331A